MAGERGKAIRAVVRGGVQGVGFRYETVERAHALGVLGWVRNLDDGTVQVHAEGAPDAVDALHAFLRQGPRGAQVESVDVEPAKVEGHEQFAIRGVSAGAFSVREHDGGFSFGLEVEGHTRAWSLRKEPTLDPSAKRFALEAEASDGGEVWDRGTYEQGGRVPWPEALERGHAVFVLHGDRLQGGFALQRTRPGQWLLVKRRDEFARS